MNEVQKTAASGDNPVPGHDVIVVGASSGGLESLTKLLATLPADLQASVLLVQHRSPHSHNGLLARIVGRKSPLPVREAADSEPLMPGQVYLAPPDRHLVVEPGKLRVTQGPKENFVRPAIDVLFRSAAVAYGPRVIGVVLIGDLDDGSAGLYAVKRCGGIAVVQNPADAQFPDMPTNALARGPVDHTVTLAEMGSLLTNLVKQPAPAGPPIPGDLRAEVKMMSEPYDTLNTSQKANWTPYSCPECSGPMREIPDSDPPRYRCHVGHGYTEQSLLADQSEATERSLWAAIRALEERANLLSKMAASAHERGRKLTATEYEGQSADSRAHAEHIRQWFSAKT